MNDLQYKREMAALTASVALGVILGLLLGFFVDGSSSLASWLKYSVFEPPGPRGREDALLWAFLGGGAATAVFYIRVFTRKGDGP